MGPPRIRPSKSNHIHILPQPLQGKNIPGEKFTSRYFTNLKSSPNNPGDQCPAPELNMKKEYQTFLKEINEKGLKIDCPESRFNKLSVDHKKMIDFESLSDKGTDISRLPNHEKVAFNMGKESVEQKGRFIGLDHGPTSMGEVVHLYNFENIRNRNEVPLLMQAVLNGAEEGGYTDGIMFINYE